MVDHDSRLPRLIRRVPPKWLPVLVLVLVAVAFLITRLDGGGDSLTSAPAAPPTATSSADPPRGGTPVSALPTVAASALPPEARETLTLIARGGPYPYARDGVAFGNRERLLPAHRSGWYREYTVITPGSSDRGARRIVAGSDGGRFYTDDHYDSFREVVG